MASRKIRVAVIFGGRSGEHEVSLVSATSVVKALDKKKYDVIPVAITKTGKWLTGKNSLEALKAGNEEPLTAITLNADPAHRGFVTLSMKKGERGLGLVGVDIVFPVLHGPYGEDGTIQGLLELTNIPYVGCGVLGSAVSMDKWTAKEIFQAHGIPQAAFIGITRSQFEKKPLETVRHIMKTIGLPCFVKPSNLGSSIGISKATYKLQLETAIRLACKFDSRILIEKAVPAAREIECAVLGNENPIASVAGEIIPSREFYDYYAKYVDGASKLIIPARLPKKMMKKVQDLAIRAFQALACSGMARVDFLMEKKTGKLYVNEVNTIPGFTNISMYPKLFEASGIPYSKLLDRLIKLGLERHKEKQRNQVSYNSGSEWYKG